MDTVAGSDLVYLRNRILNVVGHELRTPVSTIRGLADSLAQVSPTEAPGILDALRRQAARLEGLVDDLLAATGVSTALPVGPTSDVPLGEVVRNAWRAAGGEAGGVRIADPGRGHAWARRASVERAIGHVLDNALLYSSGPTDVEIDGATVTVTTPGPPVPPEDIEFATEAFWRGERAVMTAPGLGLGLYVARALAEHEGGALTMAARPGGGVQTVVQFPA